MSNMATRQLKQGSRNQQPVSKAEPEKASAKTGLSYKKVKVNLSEGVILTLKPATSNKPSNFPEWKRAVISYCILHLSGLESIPQEGILRNNSHPPPPEFPEEFDEKGKEVKPSKLEIDIAMKIWSKAFDNQDILIQNQIKNLPIFFQVIVSTLSNESEFVLQQKSTWTDIETGKKSLELYLLIEETHQNSQSGFELQDMRNSKLNYYNLKQSNNTSLHDYREQFMQMYEATLSAGWSAMDAPQLAFDYAASTNATYQSEVNQLIRNTKMGIYDFPETIEEIHAQLVLLNLNTKSTVETNPSTQAMFLTVGHPKAPKYTQEERYDFTVSSKLNKQHHQTLQKEKNKKKSKSDNNISNNNTKTKSNATSDTKSKSSSDKNSRGDSSDDSDERCSKCNRWSHSAADCWAKSKVDNTGKVIVEKPKGREKKQVIKAAITGDVDQWGDLCYCLVGAEPSEEPTVSTLGEILVNLVNNTPTLVLM